MEKEKWIPILEQIGITEDKYDKVLKYIDNHLFVETQNNIHGNGSLETTLPMALRIISKLDLDRVEFVSQPAQSGIPIVTHRESHKFQDEDIELIPNLGDHMTNEITNATIETLNNKLENCKRLYIYILFNHMSTIDRVVNVFHRFYESQEEEVVANYK